MACNTGGQFEARKQITQGNYSYATKSLQYTSVERENLNKKEIFFPYNNAASIVKSEVHY